MIYHGQDLGDYYLVSNTGEIKGVKKGKIRKKNINHEGYYFVSVSLGKRSAHLCIKVHRAVAETFLANDNNYPIINHKDCNKLNNNVKNLEWCTHKENTIHALKNNRLKVTNKKKIIRTIDNMEFNSILEAGYFINKENPESTRKNIQRALKFNGMAYGSKWIYA